MSNKNHAYDGSEVTASVTGFSEYSTRGITVATSPRPVVSPADILSQIRELRKTLSQDYIAKAISKLDNHIADTNNPHHTQLKDFSDHVIDVLYNYYVANGGLCTKSQYCAMLFKVLHVASTLDMTNGADHTALVTVMGIRHMIREHENDPNAHSQIIEKVLPGKPMTEPPIMAILAKVGLNKFMVHPTGDVPYTYVDRSRHVMVATDDDPLPQDYTYYEPLLACFGARTNEIPNSTDFSNFTYSNTSLGTTDNPDPMRGTEASAIMVEPTDEEELHTFTLADVELYGGQDKAFSVYVKPGSCKYISFTYNDMSDGTIKVQATYNLILGKAFVTNHLNRYRAEIIHLADGWYRCTFLLKHEYGQRADLVMTCFKEKDPKLQDFKFKVDTPEVGVYVWGMQYELGNNASPYIPTAGTPVTRQPVEITVTNPYPDPLTECTINVNYRNPGVWSSNLTRPLLITLNANGDSSCEITLRYDNKVEVIRWGTITVQGISTRTLTYENSLTDPKGTFIHIAHSSSRADATLAYNGTYYTNIGPAYQDDDTVFLVGRDQYNRYAECYLRGLSVYPVSATVKQCIFLNGEDINE